MNYDVAIYAGTEDESSINDDILPHFKNLEKAGKKIFYSWDPCRISGNNEIVESFSEGANAKYILILISPGFFKSPEDEKLWDAVSKYLEAKDANAQPNVMIVKIRAVYTDGLPLVPEAVAKDAILSACISSFCTRVMSNK